jgi:hypothetical protein
MGDEERADDETGAKRDRGGGHTVLWGFLEFFV